MLAYLPRIAALLLLLAIGAIPTPGVAATYTVTSKSCTGPGSLVQAIADANANPGTDTITFTPGLVIAADQCPPDSATQATRYYIGEITESVVFEGQGARLVGAVDWVNTNGALHPFSRCPSKDHGTIILAETPGFLRVGRRLEDNPAISVTIRDMSFEQMSAFVHVYDKASLVVERVHLRDIWDNHIDCGRPAILVETGGNLAVRSSRFEGMRNFGDSVDGFAWTAGIQGYKGGTLEVTDSTFVDSSTAGAIAWDVGPARIVRSRFIDAGGILHQKGTMDIVDSVFAFTASGETDRIMQIDTSRASTIRLIGSSVWAERPECQSSIGWGPCNFTGRPLLVDGGTISLVDSAIGIGEGSFASAPTLGIGVSGAGWYTANDRTWIQPTLAQGAAALRAITGQPGLLTGSGLPATPYVSYPANVTPLYGGQLVAAIADAAPVPPGPGNGSNVLLNPIDGQPVLLDAFGIARWDAASGRRSIGGVQNAATHLVLDGVENQAARLSWTRPQDGAGLPVTGYRVLYALPGQSPAPEVKIGDPATTTLRLAGLENGKTYTFEVIPVSGATPLAESNLVQGTPKGVPDAPTVTAKPGNAKVRLTWTVPPDNGSPLNGYLLRYRQAGSPTWKQWSMPSTQTDIVVGSLTNGVAYEFTIAASNFVGQGDAGSAQATPVLLPGLTYPTPVTGYENNPLAVAPTPTDTTGSVSYALSAGALPTGLTLDTGTGAISGAPIAGTGAAPPGQSYPVTITLTQTGTIPATATAALTLLVISNPPDPQLFYPDIKVVAGTGPVTMTPAVGGFAGTPVYSIVGEALPPGFTLNANGTVSGNPATATSGFVATTVRAQSGEQIAQSPLIVEVSPTLAYAPASAIVGEPVSLAPTVSPVVTPGTFSLASGTLPDGLQLNATTGVISGVPRAAGFATVAVTFTTGTQSVQTSFPLSIGAYPIVLTYPPAVVAIGEPLSIAPNLVGAKGPVVYALATGVLPDGLRLDPATGIVFGVPNGPPGTAGFSIQVGDLYMGATGNVLVTIAPAPPEPIPTLGNLVLLLLAALLGVLAASRLALATGRTR